MRIRPLLVVIALATALVGVPALGQSAAPPAQTPPAAPASSAAAPTRLKVLVLDIKSADLSQGEKDTLGSLITTHLSRYAPLEVMSGQDIRNLADVEATRQAAGCDDASCLSEIAGALGAQVIIYGQAGKLGSTLIVTLNAYDAQKGSASARQQVEARDPGQLPALIPPAVDALIAPVFDINTMQPKGVGVVRATGSSQIALGARGYDVFEARKFDICVGNNKEAWFFCQKGGATAENVFVRKYQALTGLTDLDAAEVNRNQRGIGIPAALLGIGAVGIGVSVASFVLTYAVPTAPLTSPSPTLRGQPLGLDLGIGAALVGLGFGGWGAYEAYNSLRFEDEPATAHSMTEAEGRAAVDRYNTKLAEQVNRELGTAQ